MDMAGGQGACSKGFEVHLKPRWQLSNNVAGWTEGQYFKSIYYFSKSIYDIYVYICIYTIAVYSDYMCIYI